MKITYLANVRIPTEKAHGIQIMKMCEAFADTGAEVVLFVPRRFNNIKESPFSYYGVKESFLIKRLFCLDLVFLGKVGFIIESITFAFSAFIHNLFSKTDVVYTRDEVSGYLVSLTQKLVFWEAHTNQYNFFVRRLIYRASGIIAITKGLKDFYVWKGINPDKIQMAPDGVDLNTFSIPESKEVCRERLGLQKREDTYTLRYPT